MTVMYIVVYAALFILGLGMLVRGLMTLTKARTAWMLRIVPGTAQVTACTPVGRFDDPKSLYDAIYDRGSLHRYTRARLHRGASCDTTVPGRRHGRHPVRPENPKAVYLPEHFAGWDVPLALIAVGGGLMLVSLMSLAN